MDRSDNSKVNTSNLGDAALLETATSPQRDWQAELKAGHTAAALGRYHHAERLDEEVLAALKVLHDVRRHLRAKRWAKAKRALTDIEAMPESVANIVDVEQVAQQLETLGATNKLLDQHNPEVALERLEYVTSPLLLAEAQTQRGTAYIFLDEAAQAKAAFAAALEHDPKHYRALTNRGNLSLEENEVDEAIAAYEAALRIHEDFANAHHNLGVAYRRKGQIDKSVRSIRRAQKAMRREDAEDAKGSLSGALSSFGGRLGTRRGRYTLYAVVAVVLFLWLRLQGTI